MEQYEIEFKYFDALSNWEERRQSCSLYANNSYEAKERCKELYGLGTDCDYEIVSVNRI